MMNKNNQFKKSVFSENDKQRMENFFKKRIQQEKEKFKKYNLYKVYLDKAGSGSGWEEIVKASSPEKALQKANSKRNKTERTNLDSVVQLPNDYFERQNQQQNKIEEFEREKEKKITEWTQAKQDLESKYNIEKYSRHWSIWEIK